MFRNIQKKMQSMEGSFDACTEDLFNQTIKVFHKSFLIVRISLLD
jgi:hypothetical protein